MSAYAGVTIYHVRPNGPGDIAIPIPAPASSPVVRVPLINGLTLVQVPGPRVMTVTLDLWWDTVTAHATFRQRIGTAATLVITNGTANLTYPNTLLEVVSDAAIDVDQSVTARATFSMEGY